jgi:hypothetical protein
VYGLKKKKKNNVTRWNLQFVESGSLCKSRNPGRPRVSDDNIERVRDTFQRSAHKSVARASQELGMPKRCGRCCISGYDFSWSLCRPHRKRRLQQFFVARERLFRAAA